MFLYFFHRCRSTNFPCYPKIHSYETFICQNGVKKQVLFFFNLVKLKILLRFFLVSKNEY